MGKGEFHREEYLQLADVTHKTAIVSWGSFFFRIKDKKGTLKLVDDGDLDHVHPPRHQTIGARSEPHGAAVVEVGRGDWRTRGRGLHHGVQSRPDHRTDGRHRVRLSGHRQRRALGEGELLDWVVQDGKGGLAAIGGAYDNRFRTHAHPVVSTPLVFAVLGDFGVGVRKASRPNNQQREVAAALTRAVTDSGVRLILTTGDNIYAGKKILGIPIGATGDEDDDWFFTFYQPYRYILNRVPFYPSVGNHDSGEIEFENDDRGQLMDNFFLRERFDHPEVAPFASMDPGLFYRFRFGSDIEFVCLDTSKASPLPGDRFFMDPRHIPFLDETFRAGPAADRPVWQIPFAHHPPYSAGPRHHNSSSVIKHLAPRFQLAGVRAVFCGHEHNFQHAIADTVHYFVTGGGGKVSVQAPEPDRFAGAFTVSWAAEGHFLLVEVNGPQMTVVPVGAISPKGR